MIGDDLGVIASGPTYPDETSFENALTVLELRGLLDQVPARVLVHLEAAAAGMIAIPSKRTSGRSWSAGAFSSWVRIERRWRR